ncbi:tRNA N(3)-methylcytidine methyltransferase METTL2A [Manis javanica]|nr:tRNA N(3)-methylcytidine methyltransferase METTL2A [Manis javanica]
MAGSSAVDSPAAAVGGERQQFGSRFPRDPARVFHHNVWDDVEWSEEQAAAAERKVRENSSQRVCQEKQVDYELNAHKYWNDFYKIHENGFFKDRHWLFTEFPELAPIQNENHLKDLLSENKSSEVPECTWKSVLMSFPNPQPPTEYSRLAVVWETVFPILQTNNDPRLFVYCCDFSSAAIELVQGAEGSQQAEQASEARRDDASARLWPL